MTHGTDNIIEFSGEPRDFVRVYRLPDKLTNGYCFGGGNHIVFTNVDWFEHPIRAGRNALASFIRTKRYYDPAARFLVQSDHPDFTFMVPPPALPDEEG